jgi:FkbM family methyltransferase
MISSMHIKKIIIFFKKIIPNKLFENIKNYIRLILLKLELMPDIVLEESSYYHGFVDQFLKYYKVNENKIFDLKNNLDLESQREIDFFIEKVVYISTHKILKRKDIFSQIDIAEQIESIKEIRKKTHLYKNFKYFDYYPSETFYGLNGLRWLPENALHDINNGVTLDIGACYGDSAIAFYYNSNINNIFCFEPEPDNYLKLVENLNILGQKDIVPIRAGVSDIKGTAKISSDSYVSKIGEVGNSIDLVTIDSFVEDNDIEKVSFIKIDIEGAEKKALLGGLKTIKRDLPVLSIAIYHNAQDFFEIKPWFEKLFPEYKLIVKKTNPLDPLVEVTLLAYV